MKKITLLMMTSLMFSLGNAQTNLFFDDFESYTDFIITGIGNWETLDLDGLATYTGGVQTPTYPNANAAMAFQVFNPSTTTPTAATNESDPNLEVRNFDPFSGAKFIGAWAGVPAAPVIANDDWLISPAVTLAASGNTVSFQVKALSNTYGDENYEVGVYVGSGSPTSSSDFTIIGGTRTATYPSWELVSVDLSAYDGQEIKIGIHYISSDVYLLMVDDFSVDTSLSVSDFELNRFSHSYNNELKSLSLESSNMPMLNVEIYSILGKNVLSKPLSNTSESIDVSEFQDGVYLAKIFVDGGHKTIKFIKN
ncbi:MAG: choice-of-anchor J domain-containing protein [Bacteroidota bacterium]